jgi:hypothetical protein
LEQDGEAWLQAVMGAVKRDPQRRLRGLISAVSWLAREQILARIESWSRPKATELLQTLAWRALAHHDALEDERTGLQRRFETALHHVSMHIRAAACRASPRLGRTDSVAACLRDEAGVVVVEAAIALQRSGDARGRAALLKAVVGTSAYLSQLSGHDLRRAQHRLGRWLRYLALALPPADAGVESVLNVLPPRLALQFILHHGDVTWLPRVQAHMDNPECARYAGWVWSALTGVDLQTHGLTRPRPDDAYAPSAPTDDLDPGLPLPDSGAVARFNPSLPGGQRMLLGHPIDKLDVPALLAQAPQALRWIAARHLEQRTGMSLNVRARAWQQSEIMQRFATPS